MGPLNKTAKHPNSVSVYEVHCTLYSDTVYVFFLCYNLLLTYLPVNLLICIPSALKVVYNLSNKAPYTKKPIKYKTHGYLCRITKCQASKRTFKRSKRCVMVPHLQLFYNFIISLPPPQIWVDIVKKS